MCVRHVSFVLVMAFVMTIASADAVTVTTMGSGNWSNTTVNTPWPSGVPAAGSDIVIASGHSVTVTVAVAASPNNLTIEAGGQLTVGGYNFTVSGATEVSGTLLHTNAGGTTHTFTGPVTIFSGGLWNETAAPAISFGGNLQNDGTFTAGTGVHTFSGTAKTFGGTSGIVIPSLMLSGTYTNNGTLTVATTLAGAGTLTQGASTSSILNFGGSSIAPTLAATNSGNTVNYTGTAQTVKGTIYNNLTLSGSGIKTLTSVTVNGILSMEGTCTASVVPTYGPAATLQYNTATGRNAGPEWKTPFVATGGVLITNTGIITQDVAKVFSNSIPLAIRSGATLACGNFKLILGGAFTNDGTFAAGTGTVEWVAVGAQNIATGAYYNVILSGSGAKSIFSNTTIANNLSVAPTGSTATALVETGINLAGINSLTLGSLSRINGTWGSSSATSATYTNDTFFSPSTGYLTVTADTRTTPLFTSWPTASTIITGQMLSASTLIGGSATNAMGMTVAGVFTFTSPTTIPPLGPYVASVTFTPTDPTSFLSANNTVTVPVASLNVYYVVPTNPLSASPYDTWAKAATNIQTAVDKASIDLIPGTVECTVIVTNGVYSNAVSAAVNAVAISNSITLRGVGADKVTITGRGSKRGLFLTNAPAAVVEGFTIAEGVHNANPSFGAGILMYGGTVRNCVISNNLASQRMARGGGVNMVGGTLEDCVLVSNRVTGTDGYAYGAAIYAQSGAVIQRCRIFGNRSEATYATCVGAVYLANNSDLRNCLIYNNYAGGEWTPGMLMGSYHSFTPSTAGVYSEQINNRIIFCTIVGNTLQSGVGAGMYLLRGFASNNIVYYNSTEFARDYRAHHDNVFKTTNRADTVFVRGCAYPPVDGAGNISAEPQFMDWPNADFRLTPGSPCLDAALAIPGISGDFAGVERTVDGNGDGTGAPDMGAWEAAAANAGALRCGFTSPTNEAIGAFTASFAAHVAGANTNDAVFTWDFENDGTDDAVGTGVDHTFLPGFYTVKLSVTTPGESAFLIKNNEIRVAPAVVHVATNGAHVFPFTNAATAATNIQAAVDVALALAAARSEVVVAAGVYPISRQIIVDKSIVLRSTTGPTNTIVTAQSVAGRRVLELFGNATNAIVDGFTLTGGLLPTIQYGAGINMYTGLVQNCIVRNNGVSGRMTKAGGVYMSGGTLRNCVIAYNSVAGTDGGGYGAGVFAGGAALIDRCRISSNRATASTSGAVGGGVFLDGVATLRNSVVVSNTVGGNTTVANIRGGGVYCNTAGSRVENSTVADNVAQVGNSAGLYLLNGSMTNTILWRNYLEGSDPDNLENHRNYELAKTNVGHCLSHPLPPGTNNVTGDPQFFDRANGNYRILSSLSSAIDNGTNLVAVTNDFDGIERPKDGNTDTVALPDIGAFEYDPSGLEEFSCDFLVDPAQGVNLLEAVLTATVSGPGAATAHYFWDFENDGEFNVDGPDRAVVTNTFGVGVYTVNLVVSNTFGTVTNRLKVDVVRVMSDVAYVTTNGAHQSPFETWAKAATNLPAAISAVAAGGRVYVSNGVYQVSQQISVNRPVTVIGVNGATNTIVARATNAPSTRVFFLSDAGARLEGLTIRGGFINDGINYGAGVYVADGTVSDCIVLNNAIAQRPARGGGIYLLAGTVRGCLIVSNAAYAADINGFGGGIFAAGGTVESCVVMSNRASVSISAARGGGVFLDGAAVLRNSVVVRNTVGGNTTPELVQGGGVFCNGAAGRVEHCTIADNFVDIGLSAGLCLTNGAVTNTLIWRNYLTGGDPDSLANHRNVDLAPGKTLSYCDSYPQPDGVENIAADPLFADRAGGDYQLGIGSPAIDAGTNLTAVTNDIAGTVRPLDGDDDAAAVADLGAFEFDPASITELTCNFSADPAQGVNQLVAVLTAVVSGPGSDSVYYFWDFENDGLVDAEGWGRAVVTNTYEVGSYSVNLTASNVLGAVTNALKADYIQVVADVAYVALGGGHIAPFDTPAKAATNIQAAALIVAAGGHVYVAPGVYTVTQQISITRPVSVVSLGGAGATTLQLATGKVGRVLALSAAAASVEGFTIRGGNLDSSDAIIGPGGAGANVQAGILRACVVVSNTIGGRYSSGGGVFLGANGVLENCLIIGNNAGAYDSAYGGGVCMLGGRVVNCTISGNRAAYSTTVGLGGGLYRSGGAVTNTIVFGNYASATDGGNDLYGVSAAIAYSCSPDLTAGVNNNLTADPLFKTPGSGYGLAHVRGDNHVDNGSPCRNVGGVQEWMTGATDLDGLPRLFNRKVDMGCYQTSVPRGTIFVIQ